MSTSVTVILGGGFGGLAAANALRQLLPAEHEIVVVDRTSHFYVGAGNTWIMLGQRTFEQISQARASLLRPGIRFSEAQIQTIDLPGRSVTTDRGALKWDHLIVALGANLNVATVPGLAEAAHTFYTVEGAQKLKGALEQFAGGDLLILIPSVPFKCPPAPYEAALLLQEAMETRGLAGKVRLAIHTAEGAPMTTAGPEMGQFIKDELARRSIAYHPLQTTAKVDGAAQRVMFADGSEARYDLLIAIPPHEAPPVVRAAGLTNPAGWVPVDPHTLQASLPAGVSGVYAVGDVTVMPLPGRFKPDIGLSLPKAGVFAEAEGRAAAHQIAAKILGGEPGEAFDGKGYCFLETGAQRAVKAEGSFFDLPHPVMHKVPADEAQYQAKLDWMARLLQPVR